jgi:predicted MFS family arabinose efflux permease
VLTAGFLRFVCKFALVAYLPLLLVDGGASLGQAALVLSVASGVAAAITFVVVGLLRRTSASLLLGAAVVVVGVTLLGFALAPNWQVALVVAVAFGIADGTLSVVQNALVTEAAPAGVRAGLVAVSGMTRNAGKLVAPLAMGALILTVPVSAALALVGAATLASVPLLRPVRRLDPLLAARGRERREVPRDAAAISPDVATSRPAASAGATTNRRATSPDADADHAPARPDPV